MNPEVIAAAIRFECRIVGLDLVWVLREIEYSLYAIEICQVAGSAAVVLIVVDVLRGCAIGIEITAIPGRCEGIFIA